MATITLFRHGRDDDAYRGGWSQRGLVAEGFRQSAALGAYLAGNRNRFPFAVLLSSDLRRARETAEEIATAVGVAVEYAPEWRETNNGILAGMLNSQALERFPGLYWNTLRMDERYPGGESPAEFFERVRGAFEGLSSDIVSGARPADVGIVTHGGVINAIYHLAKGLQWSNSQRGFPAVSTSVHKMVYQGGRWTFAGENLQDHLTALSAGDT